MRMITMRDPSLEHQITITAPGGAQRIEVSCNCRALPRRGPARYDPIAVAKCWEAEDAWRVWKTYHALLGITVLKPTEELAEVTG